MFTSTVPTPSITPPHEHTHPLSHTHTETTFYSLSVPLFTSSAQILPTKPFSCPFSLFFFITFLHLCAFINPCVPECHCLICLLNPLHHPLLSLLPPLAKLTCFPAAANGALYSCKLARGEKERERGGGGTTRKKKTAAALTAVSMVRLLTWQSAPPRPTFQTPFPLSLALTC